MQLQSMGFKPLAILFAVVAVGPIISIFALRGLGKNGAQVAFWSILCVSVLAFCIIGFSMLNRGVNVENGILNVKSTFYKVSIPLVEITDMRVVAEGSVDDVVGIRVNGVGLPGFRSGWFNSKSSDRLFVDIGGGEYLLIYQGGKPRLALEFSNNLEAKTVLGTAVLR